VTGAGRTATACTDRLKASLPALDHRANPCSFSPFRRPFFPPSASVPLPRRMPRFLPLPVAVSAAAACPVSPLAAAQPGRRSGAARAGFVPGPEDERHSFACDVAAEIVARLNSPAGFVLKAAGRSVVIGVLIFSAHTGTGHGVR
jgi:hypothetical protein